MAVSAWPRRNNPGERAGCISFPCNVSVIPQMQSTKVSFTEAARTFISRTISKERSTFTHVLPHASCSSPQQDQQPRRDYDFIVIGYGAAGQSAVETLQKVCPTASIALVDSLRRPSDHTIRQQTDFFAARAIGLSPRDRRVDLDHDNDVDDDVSNESTFSLTYRVALLLATGARGAPPPTYLMEVKARSRILELRSTTSHQAEIDNGLSVQDNADPSSNLNQRPILSAEETRRRVAQYSKEGAAIAILGSGWDAVDLAVSASTASKQPKNTKAKRTTIMPPTIVFGAHGPLSHVLPNYLSNAVSKRLQSRNVRVLDRSLVRYISCEQKAGSPRSIRLYTAKLHDFLEGSTASVDWVVIAPEVKGPRGNGSLSTCDTPDVLDEIQGRSWYRTWTGASIQHPDDPGLLVCYKDDGRIAVNTALNACQGIYAAGSAAKYANTVTGHATVAGDGVHDGTEAGRVAAMNMARDYNKRIPNVKNIIGFGTKDGEATEIFVKDPMPIWRSDLRTTIGSNEDKTSTLSEAGIVALCIGNCDSECLSTHGVWWTNQAAQQRMIKLISDETNVSREETMTHYKMIAKKQAKPVYGFGVVYYLDRTGRIRGIMTWGLPFHKSNKLNKNLVDFMKNVLRTNGGFRSVETDIDRIKMTNYLGEASKRMVRISFEGVTSSIDGMRNLGGEIDSFSRPLHRFTDVRPPNVRSIGLLKRKDGFGQGILGEDLFARYEDDDQPETPVPKPRALDNVGSAASSVEARYNWNVWEQKERRWDENEGRARPTKEDHLWIRKGDEMRNTPQSEHVTAAYNNAINTKRYGT